MQNTTRDLADFCKLLPKVELHAHLNGSLSQKTLTTLQAMHVAAGGEQVLVPDIRETMSLEECFSVFGVAHSLTSTLEAVRAATRDVIREFAADGVIYLELRTTPREVATTMSRKQYVDAVVEEIVRATSEPPDLRRSPMVKLLLSVDRRGTLGDAEETLELALSARARAPHVVVGMDLSGDPSRGRAQTFLPVMKKARDAGLRVSLHCAEVEAYEETLAILQSKAFDRLGHCTTAAQPDDAPTSLWHALRATATPVEACLSSNLKCGTVAAIGKHHFGALWVAGHPVVLCTDDKGVFATSLSKELKMAAVQWHLSKTDLWQLSCNAISSSFASDEEKQLLQEYLSSWRQSNNHLFM